MRAGCIGLVVTGAAAWRAGRRACRMVVLSLALAFAGGWIAGVRAETATAPVSVALAELPASQLADRIVVWKRARRLQLLRDGRVLKSYPIGLGRHPVGPKRREGDGRTPEGEYVVDGRNPRSRYHLSLHISYPNERDVARAESEGVPPGGAIMLHGLPDGVLRAALRRGMPDWTEGCIALANAAIEDLWRRVPDGTPIDIRP